MTRIRVEPSEPVVQEEQPGRGYYTPLHARANEWSAPTFRALRIGVGAILLGLALAVIWPEPDERLGVAFYGVVVGVVLGALGFLGLGDLLSMVLHLVLAERIDVDTNHDGRQSPEEQAEAEHLFTVPGLQRFVAVHLYDRADWTARALIGRGFLSPDEYKVVINDILPTVGVLERHVAPKRTRGIRRGDDGLPIGQEEALRRIEAYFHRGNRKVWSFQIGGRRVIL